MRVKVREWERDMERVSVKGERERESGIKREVILERLFISIPTRARVRFRLVNVVRGENVRKRGKVSLIYFEGEWYNMAMWVTGREGTGVSHFTLVFTGRPCTRNLSPLPHIQKKDLSPSVFSYLRTHVIKWTQTKIRNQVYNINSKLFKKWRQQKTDFWKINISQKVPY